MTPLTQSAADEALPRVNQIITEHNARRPRYPLQEIPDGVIHVGSRTALEGRLGESLADSAAGYSPKTGHIYLVDEEFESVVEQLRALSGELPRAYRRLDYPQVTLWHLIVHENIHRSCKIQEMSADFSQFLFEAIKVFFKEAPWRPKLDRFANEPYKGEASGFRFFLKLQDGHNYHPSDELDEYVTVRLGADTLAPHLIQRDILPPDEISYALLVCQKVPEDGWKAFVEVRAPRYGTSIYTRMMADHLCGEVPTRFNEALARHGDFDQPLADAIAAYITGSLKLASGLFGCLYKEEPPTSPRGMKVSS